MKKGLFLFLALLVVAVCAFASAEETTEQVKPADLFDLWDYGGESPAWVASAFPVFDGILLTSPGILPENTADLVASDGQDFWEVKAVFPDKDGVLALVIIDSDVKPSRYGAWPLLSLGDTVPADSCYVRYGDSMGSRINRAVLFAESCQWKGHGCYLLTLTDPVPAGSPVLTADGRLAGFVAAEWAEGINCYLVLPAEEITGKLTEMADLMGSLPDWGNAPEGFVVTMDKNLATIDWQEMTLPEKAKGETIYLVIADTGNTYFNYYNAELANRTVKMLTVPGRLYLAGLVVSASAPHSLPENYALFAAPAARKLTDYHFRPVQTAIAEAPAEGLKADEAPVPVEEVTEELLRSGRAYFYSHSAYQVTETISDLSLLVALTDPEGVNYCWESSWIYGPEYMESDIWFVPLDQAGLLGELNQRGYPRGVYQVAYYIEGALADSFEFELK